MTEIKRLGPCSQCGGRADWNTPCVDKDLNLYCATCSMESTKMLYAIEQHTENGHYKVNPRYMEFVKNHCVIHTTLNFFGVRGKGNDLLTIYLPNFVISAWTHDGHRTFPLTDEEKLQVQKSPEAILDMMADLISRGKTRCTRCGKEMDEKEIAGHPLFAGCNCKECFEEHKRHLEEERKKGHVCRMCGQPYGNCSC